ncbi:MAG: CpaF family protein [Acidobacterium ailaaui]|jgi:pilus assembly protein CpaF|nr:CpaF family protein [Pseudacidobacterium ailaaui]
MFEVRRNADAKRAASCLVADLNSESLADRTEAPVVIPRQYPLDEVQRVHQRMIDEMKAENLNDKDWERVKDAARLMINKMGLQYPNHERDELAAQVADEIIGHGPIEPLLREERISDIMINGPFQIFCEIEGINRLVPIRFRDEDHLRHHIDRIVAAVGHRIDESSPMVNARLKDGSRFNAILPPLSLKGPAVSIRKFGTHKIRGPELVKKKSLAPWMLEFLEAAVRARLNIVISGGTGAGKTTLLNTISQAIPDTERILTIEDSAELQISQPNVVPLETRTANLEGKGAVTQRDLLINALRMKPDRIIIGECRGGETFDMLQAMNTGHEGSLTTVHANSPRDALSRIQNMVLMGDMGLSEDAINRQIAAAIHLIVQAVRLSDGSRRISAISEITGMQGMVISMQDIFSFQQKTTDANGMIHGSFVGNGIVPECVSKIERMGKKFPPGFFNQRMDV